MKRARSTTSGKMVHYTVPTPDDGVTMTFYVAVRPCITYLVSRHPELFDPKSGGTTTILLASANDDERTEAVLEYLTYEGKTLSELSPLARYIPRSEFLDNYEVSRSGHKRIHDIRKYAESNGMLSPNNGLMIFLDDKAPGNCCGVVTSNDYPTFMSSWDLPESLHIMEQHLKQPELEYVFVPTNDEQLMEAVIRMLSGGGCGDGGGRGESSKK